MEINYIVCSKCNTLLVSLDRHDFNCCKCGEVSIDGGMDYFRTLGNPLNYTKGSETVQNLIPTIRNRFKWTSVLDKDGTKLKTPKTKLLRNLSTDHIISILQYILQKPKSGNKSVSNDLLITLQIFLAELKFRENGKSKKQKRNNS